jgi:hypothetical protein
VPDEMLANAKVRAKTTKLSNSTCPSRALPKGDLEQMVMEQNLAKRCVYLSEKSFSLRPKIYEMFQEERIFSSTCHILHRSDMASSFDLVARYPKDFLSSQLIL